MRVLIATDGSESAVDAAGRGLALLPPDPEVTLVTVVPPERIPFVMSGEFEVPMMTPTDAEQLHELDLSMGRGALARTQQVIDSKIVQSGLVAGTDIADAICSYAAESHAQVLVLGDSHHGWLHHAIHGSIVQHVVRRSPCPVLVVPHPSHRNAKASHVAGCSNGSEIPLRM